MPVFDVGNIVKEKGKDQLMVVETFADRREGDFARRKRIICKWYDDNTKEQKKEFSPEELERVY